MWLCVSECALRVYYVSFSFFVACHSSCWCAQCCQIYMCGDNLLYSTRKVYWWFVRQDFLRWSRINVNEECIQTTLQKQYILQLFPRTKTMWQVFMVAYTRPWSYFETSLWTPEHLGFVMLISCSISGMYTWNPFVDVHRWRCCKWKNHH